MTWSGVGDHQRWTVHSSMYSKYSSINMILQRSGAFRGLKSLSSGQGVLPHALRLECLRQVPDRIIHVPRHGHQESAVLRIKGLTALGQHLLLDLLVIVARHLERRVQQVEGVEEEERMIHIRRVVLFDDLQGMLLKHLLLIARWRLLHARLTRIRQVSALVGPAIARVLDHEVIEGVETGRDLARRLDARLLVPVVVGMLVVHKGALKSSAIRCMLRRRHASIPLARVVCAIAALPQRQDTY